MLGGGFRNQQAVVVGHGDPLPIAALPETIDDAVDRREAPCALEHSHRPPGRRIVDPHGIAHEICQALGGRHYRSGSSRLGPTLHNPLTDRGLDRVVVAACTAETERGSASR